jgi:mitochondrial fission protein ELM1
MSGEAPHCLVLSDGRRGIENQALGLAESCAALRPLKLRQHHVSHSKMVAALPPRAQLRLGKFDLPKCDIAIGCGRQAIAPLLYLKSCRPEVMTVYVQDPRMEGSAFDLIIAPEHDALQGDNVESMIGSPNRVTKDKIILETLNFATGLSKLAMPRTAMLIGGTSKTHNLDKDTHQSHLEIARTLRTAGQSLLISTSRRTPDFAVADWRRFSSDNDHVWLHDGDGPNPYFAFLGGAEMILVTEDSTNMLTEACATGKPVYRLPMSGKPGKFWTLYGALERRCGASAYAGQLSGDDYAPLNETARVAQRVWERYDARKTA